MNAVASTSSECSRFTPEAPREIWQHIFRFATTSPEYYRFCETEYTPFQDGHLSTESARWRVQEAITIKRNLVLVCKEWQALASEFLYEDIRIRHGARGLVDVLERSAKEMRSAGYGYWVRRVELPSTRELDDDALLCPVPLMDILKWCPRVEILALHGGVDIQFWDGFPSTKAIRDDADRFSLASLKRLDWGFAASAATFSINYTSTRQLGAILFDVIIRSPNLQYFSLSSPEIFQAFDRDAHPVLFPSLTTLRLQKSPSWTAGLQLRDMPILTQIITDSDNMHRFNPTPLSVMNAVGQHVRVMELADDEIRRTFSPRSTMDLLKQCPNLQELALHAGRHSFPLVKVHHLSMNCIRLFRKRDQNPGWFVHVWLSRQREALFSGLFPALERVVLHGHWEFVVTTFPFRTFRQALRKQGCTLEYEDGSVVE